MSETVTQISPNPPEKRRKRWVLPLVIVLVLLAGAAVTAKLTGLLDRQHPGPIDVDPGQHIDIETFNYYSGVVEPQETWDVQRDAGREVAEIFVSVGDSVVVGQELFSYDISDVNMQIQQTQLEINGIRNELDGYAGQIKELSDLRAATEDESLKLEYTVQIQELQTSQKQAQLNLERTQIELENIRKGTENAVVTSTMDGVVRQINNADTGYGEPTAFMTILATGAYRIKASVDELNVSSLCEGMAVVVHSRVDSERTWSGTVTRIDTENPADSGQGDYGYYYDSDMGEGRATKYYFYVSLTDSDGLLLGQHVYVEPLTDGGMAFPDDSWIDDGMAIDDGFIDGGMAIDDGAIVDADGQE